MKTKLKNIATIQNGYSFRSRLEKDPYGNVSVVQMKDLTTDNRVNVSGVVISDVKEVKEYHQLRRDDIIFRTRGLDTTACILDEEIENSILAAPLLRIRVDEEKVLPKYLQWYINQSPAQSFLNSRARGTTQKMITKQALEELEVEMPTLDRQNLIIELANLSNQEQSLLTDLAQKKKEYISAILINSIKEK